MKKLIRRSMLLSSLLLLPLTLPSQEIVHALCGTVSSINPTAKTITLFQDSGSPATKRRHSSAASNFIGPLPQS